MLVHNELNFRLTYSKILFEDSERDIIIIVVVVIIYS
jgi:hypothetical protein